MGRAITQRALDSPKAMSKKIVSRYSIKTSYSPIGLPSNKDASSSAERK